MPDFKDVSAVVTDIEGTTSSISFVHDVLFPYAAEHLPAYVRAHAQEPAVAEQLQALNREAGLQSPTLEAQIEQLLEWIRNDVKATPLKALQGYIWEAGYRNGDYRAHVYLDVAPRLREWKDQGLSLYVYSSGSVLAPSLGYHRGRQARGGKLSDYHGLRQCIARKHAVSVRRERRAGRRSAGRFSGVFAGAPRQCAGG